MSFLEQQVGTKQPVVPTGCSTKSYFFLMEQPVEFLEQLVGTTGRLVVPTSYSDRLFRKTKNFLMERAIEKSEA